MHITALILAAAFVSGSEAEVYRSVYFCVYQADSCVTSQEPVDVNAEAMPDLLAEVAALPENFIGFVDDSGTSIQFFVEELDRIWVEIPFPDLQGSYGAHVPKAGMQEIVKDLKAPYAAYKDSLGLQFQPW